MPAPAADKTTLGVKHMITAHEKNHLTDSTNVLSFIPAAFPAADLGAKTGAAPAPTEFPVAQRRELIIEFADMNLRLKGDLFGVEGGQFILVKLSPCDFIGTFNSEFIKKNPVTVKYHFKDIIYGFEARVINIISIPSKLMFLTYPNEIKTYNHHVDARYLCFLPAMTMANNEIIDMTVVDISKDGVRCVIDICARKDDALYRQMQINRDLDIRANLPGAAGKLNFKGRVRNVSKAMDKITIGLHFIAMDPESRKNLESYLIFLGTRTKN